LGRTCTASLQSRTEVFPANATHSVLGDCRVAIPYSDKFVGKSEWDYGTSKHRWIVGLMDEDITFEYKNVHG